MRSDCDGGDRKASTTEGLFNRKGGLAHRALLAQPKGRRDGRKHFLRLVKREQTNSTRSNHMFFPIGRMLDYFRRIQDPFRSIILLSDVLCWRVTKSQQIYLQLGLRCQTNTRVILIMRAHPLSE